MTCRFRVVKISAAGVDGAGRGRRAQPRDGSNRRLLEPVRRSGRPYRGVAAPVTKYSRIRPFDVSEECSNMPGPASCLDAEAIRTRIAEDDLDRFRRSAREWLAAHADPTPEPGRGWGAGSDSVAIFRRSRAGGTGGDERGGVRVATAEV